jgi:hypothetical protein
MEIALSVKVTVTLSPGLSEVLTAAIAIFGGGVSTALLVSTILADSAEVDIPGEVEPLMIGLLPIQED